MKQQDQPLTRLCGLETEYAIHLPQDKKSFFDAKNGPSNQRIVFDAILAQLGETIPMATPQIQEAKNGAFLANGCALWFETTNPGDPEGLFEAASPECHGPSQMVAASRGLEQLLIQATDRINEDTPGNIRLLKNCIDPMGTPYGAQENYEVEIYKFEHHRTWALKIGALKILTRITLGGLMFGLIIGIPWIGLMLSRSSPTLFVLMLLALFPIVFLAATSKKLRKTLFLGYLSLMLIPKTIGVSLLYRFSIMGETYKKMTPFLVSRIIFAGAGGLDKKGRFYLGQKAISRNCDWLKWNATYQNGIFCFNQIFKDLIRSITGKGDGSLYRTRQRLALEIGDSNMCQSAEYLRVATTALVIDAIEAGAITDAPKLKGSLSSLNKFNFNPEMNVEVKTSRGMMTAIQIQQFYLNACGRYIETLEEPPEEAYFILQRWSQVLRQLSEEPDSLFGVVDWVTKRAIMRRVVDQSAPTVRSSHIGTTDEFRDSQVMSALRKADVKYHELSSDGYYYKLFNEDLTTPILEPDTIERARRMPPLSNPAAQRCRYIREFTNQIEWVRWESIKLVGRAEPIVFSREQEA